jgi:ribonuclease-3
MGRGERQQGQASTPKALSDHIEALVGAAYLAGGWPGAEAFVDAMLADVFPDVLPDADARASGAPGSNPMSTLNELIQRRWPGEAPEWVDERLGGPDHAPLFVATVMLPDGTSHSGGAASTVKAAKASAAAAALVALRGAP